MASNEYSEDMLATAFDHLCENKNAKLKFWMDSYFFTQL